VAALPCLEVEGVARLDAEEAGVHADAAEPEVVEGAVCHLTSEVETSTNHPHPLTGVLLSAAKEVSMGGEVAVADSAEVAVDFEAAAVLP